eukprot:snap_masked-scaffold_3-processed-gene-9.0-mRNA-1 protein AED:0.74 eAED:0.74 QI:0/-1/0/1/-1/1/1/0/91
MLQTYEIKPILVFDGGKFPLKTSVESSRHQLRLEARIKGFRVIVRKKFWNKFQFENVLFSMKNKQISFLSSTPSNPVALHSLNTFREALFN